MFVCCVLSSENTPEGRRVTKLDQILLNGNNIAMMVPGGEYPYSSHTSHTTCSRSVFHTSSCTHDMYTEPKDNSWPCHAMHCATGHFLSISLRWPIKMYKRPKWMADKLRNLIIFLLLYTCTYMYAYRMCVTTSCFL